MKTMHEKPKIVLIAAVLASILTLPVSQVDAFYVRADASVDPGAFSPDSPVTDSQFANISPVSAGATLTSSFGGATFNGTAAATTGYAQMSNYASVNLTNYSPNSYQSICGPGQICGPGGSGPVLEPVRAGSITHEAVNISSPNLTGTAYVRIGFGVSGTTSLTSNVATDLLNFGGPIAQGILSIYTGIYGVNQSLVNSWGYTTGTGTVFSNLIPFTYGTPLDYSVSNSVFIDPADFITPGNLYDLTGVADFANTITLTEIAVFNDPAGLDPVSVFNISADSGTVYPTSSAPEPVPEPCTFALLGFGLAGMTAYSKRKRKTGAPVVS